MNIPIQLNHKHKVSNFTEAVIDINGCKYADLVSFEHILKAIPHSSFEHVLVLKDNEILKRIREEDGNSDINVLVLFIQSNTLFITDEVHQVHLFT